MSFHVALKRWRLCWPWAAYARFAGLFRAFRGRGTLDRLSLNGHASRKLRWFFREAQQWRHRHPRRGLRDATCFRICFWAAIAAMRFSVHRFHVHAREMRCHFRSGRMCEMNLMINISTENCGPPGLVAALFDYKMSRYPAVHDSYIPSSMYRH